jgi:hypothetical protein
VGDVAQLGGLGDRFGTGLDIAGRPSPEVGLDAATTGLPLLSVWVGRVIGSTEPYVKQPVLTTRGLVN